jgi:multidrug resistance protein
MATTASTLPEQQASLRQTLLSPVDDSRHQDETNAHCGTIDHSASAPPLERPQGCWARFNAFRRSPSSIVVVVAFALLVDLLVYTIIVPVLPLFTEREFNGSATIIGVLFAAYAAGLLICTPLFAAFSDRRQTRRSPMLCGLLCLAASTVLFGICKHLWQLIIARIMQGASAAATNCIGLAMISDVYKSKEIGSAMGVVMSIQGIGALIGPPLGGALYDNVSFLSIFLVCGGCALLDLVFRLVLIDDQWMADQRERVWMEDGRGQLEAERENMHSRNESEKYIGDTAQPNGTDANAPLVVVDEAPSSPSNVGRQSISSGPAGDAAVVPVSPSSATAAANSADPSASLATPPPHRHSTSAGGPEEKPALMTGLVPYRASVESREPTPTRWAPAKKRGELKHVSRPSMEAFYQKVDGQVDAEGFGRAGEGGNGGGEGGMEMHRETSMAPSSRLLNSDGSPIRPAVLSLSALLSFRPLLITNIAIITLAAIFTGIEPLLALHFNDAFGSSSSAIGYSEFSIAIPFSLFAAVIGAYTESYNKKYIVATGFGIMAVALGTFDLPKSLYWSIPPMIGIGVGMGFAGQWKSNLRAHLHTRLRICTRVFVAHCLLTPLYLALSSSSSHSSSRRDRLLPHAHGKSSVLRHGLRSVQLIVCPWNVRWSPHLRRALRPCRFLLDDDVSPRHVRRDRDRAPRARRERGGGGEDGTTCAAAGTTIQRGTDDGGQCHHQDGASVNAIAFGPSLGVGLSAAFVSPHHHHCSSFAQACSCCKLRTHTSLLANLSIHCCTRAVPV